MAKNKVTINGSELYKFTRTVGHKLNDAGKEVPVRKTFYGKTKKEAEAKYRQFLDDKKAGLENSKQYFGVAADNWIKNFFMFDGSIKDNTKLTYLRYWDKYIKPLPLYYAPLNEVTAGNIQGVYVELFKNGVPSSGISKIHKLMRKFYRYLDVQGIWRDITGSIRIPKETKAVENENVITTWTKDEISTIFSNFDNAQEGFRIRFLLILAYYTGCRISELLALTYDDFTEDGLRINKQVQETITYNADGEHDSKLDITAPKSNSSVRTIPLHPIVLKELEKHRKWQIEDGLKNGYRPKYLFTTQSNTFYYVNNIRRACKRYYARIGVPHKSFHTYRHTFGTELCRNGVPIQVASKLLGHEDITTTSKYYVSVTTDQKQDAINTLTMI